MRRWHRARAGKWLTGTDWPSALLCTLFGLGMLLAGCESRTAAVRRLEEGDAAERQEAARELGGKQGGRPDIEALPVLVESLKDADLNVRRLSAYALGRMGPDGREALPALRSSLEDEEEGVRLAAAYAINAIDPGDASPVPVLSEAAAGGEARAIVALGRMGPTAAGATNALRGALGSRVPLVRSKAAAALGQIGPAAKPAIPALKRALGDADEDVRAAAKAALASIQTSA